MATPVNDVMNVIASPDYGIKNIAGTNQEILAILQGTSNSKNNIHFIVDDIKTLLQKLVSETTEKKSIEVQSTSTKSNHKHIQDILNETKGIKKSIDNLTKAFLSKNAKNYTPTIAKLSDKASEKVADAMIKNIDKQNKNSGLSNIIDAFNKLKDISLKDIMFANINLNLISKLFKNAKEDLKINDKEFNNIVAIINGSSKIIKTLKFVNGKIDKIIKNKVIEKISNILIGENSLLSLSQILQKNKKTFDDANKTSKSIKELITSLNITMRNLFFASLWAKITPKGFESIELMTNKIFDLSKKLIENKKNIDASAKAAKNITILVGNLLVTSIFLTVAAVTGVPAMLGALCLRGVVELTIPIAEILSKKNKHIKKSVNSALLLTAFTGLMTVTSLLLVKIAENGKEVLWGSVVMAGVVAVNILTFKILSKTSKNILIGSASMLIMGASLLLFGIALGKITQATKDVTWKQFGVIAAITGLFGGVIGILGIPSVAPFIIIGSIMMAVMGLALMPFATTLGKISKATKDITMNQILLVSGSILTLGSGVAGLAILSIPIGIGSITLLSMTNALHTFTKTLKTINDMGSIPTKMVHQILNTMNSVGNFFTKNSLKLKAIKNSYRYKDIISTFERTIKHLSKLKELGSIPMKLVQQTLNAMSAIANYYKENSIEKEVIKQARRYKRMLRPFGKTLNYLSKLKEMGNIPMKLVQQTLNAMSAIANYYMENPIERKAIRQARRYKRMLRPFGKTLNYFGKLKEMGSIPMKLVHQTLDAISTIANFYLKQDVGIFESIDTTERAIMINNTIASFGKTLEYLKKLKDTSIPTKVIESAITSINNISKFYNDTNVISATKSIKQITNVLKWSTLNSRQQERAWRNINILNGLTSAMSNLSNINNSNFTAIGDSLSHTLNGVNTVDLGKVQAVTNMFNAFNGINKSESILNKFTESVKEFTISCQNLMNAMNYNTDAINNIDTSGIGGSYINEIKENNVIEFGSDNINKSNGVNIINVEEIAKNIAEKINGTLSVDIPDTQVQLLINGTGGNEWIISRY